VRELLLMTQPGSSQRLRRMFSADRRITLETIPEMEYIVKTSFVFAAVVYEDVVIRW